MNPSLKLLLVLLISLEATFTSNLAANLIVIVTTFLLLWHYHFTGRQFLRLLLIPLLPAGALVITIGFFSPGHNWPYGWMLVSRIYLYVSCGALFVHTTSPLTLARSLEQNCHLPSKYAYGVLAALNLVPRIKQSITTIYQAGLMRGVSLHWWSPSLYFKAILAAIQWSEQLAVAMESHGFVEGQARTYAQQITVTKRDWWLFIGAIVAFQVILIALPPLFMR